MGIFTKLFSGTGEVVETKVNMEDYTPSGLIKEGTSRNTSANQSISVTEDVAMKIASLYQGVNIISDTIASMPILLFKNTDGFQEVFALDPRSRALSDMSNEVLTAYNLKKNLVKDLILYGNAYAKINREGEKVALHYLPVDLVTPKMDSTGYFFNVQSHSTDVGGESLPSESVDFFDMLVLIRNPKHNSIVGQGLLEYAKDIFEMSVHETSYMINLFKNGLSAKAVLNSKTPFKKEVKDKLKEDLREFYTSSNNAGKMLVLEGDVQVLPLSLTPTDIKLIENKHFTISEIARFLNIPKHMLSLDRQQGTYSNITQERLQLLQNTLTPYTVALESALNQKLLTEEEQAQGYYFQFDTSEMLKLTPEDNARYMLELYRENVVTLEEMRASLNLGGNKETIDELKKIDAQNQQSKEQMLEEKPPAEEKEESPNEKSNEESKDNSDK